VLGLADPTTATRSFPISSPSSTHTRFCCRHGPLVAWATARPASPRGCGGGLADADEPGGDQRVGGQRAARRVHVDSVAEPQRPPQETSWWVKGACSSATSTGRPPTPGPLAGQAGRGESVEVAHAEGVGLDPVVDAPDPGRALGQLAGPVAGGQDHRGGRRR
jgi:hypothetical protein